ncbi:heme-binding protein, partial [Alkalihalophilus pseudofirmus]
LFNFKQLFSCHSPYEAFGIHQMLPGKFAIFVGGFPIVINGEVVGGVGVSGGNGEQDTAVGTAALTALQEYLASEGLDVITDADIKK